MKKNVILQRKLILLIIISIQLSYSASALNLITNPGFENGTTIPLNWTFVTQNSNTPVWDTVSHTGTKSVKISISGTNNRISGYPKSDIIPVQSLTTFVVSTWGKTSGTGGTNTPAVRVVELDANKNFLKQTNLPVFGRGTNAWTQKTIEFNTDSTTKYLYVYANIWRGYGTFWLDDVSVSLKNPTFTPTPVPTPTPIPTGTTYYVAKNGSDSNPGTETQPWLTITKAANTAVAGDIVYVANGTYPESVVVSNSGSSGKYISFISTNKWGAIIDGISVPISVDGNGFGGGLFNIKGKSYIKIKNFKIINSTSVGIFSLESGSTYPDHLWFEGNYIYNTSSSAIIIRTGTNHMVLNNVAAQNAHGVKGTGKSQEIISLQGIENNPDSVIVNFNISGNNISQGDNPIDGGEGIDCKVGCKNGTIHDNNVDGVVSTGIYLDGYGLTTSNVSIYNNRVNGTNRRWGHGISIGAENGGNATDISVFNNVVTNNDYNGIDIPASNEGITIQNISVCYNTIVNNGIAPGTNFGGIGIKLWYYNPIISNITICNNIVSQNQDFSIVVDSVGTSNINITNNLIYGYKSFNYQTWNETLGNNSIQLDPQFVSETDFSLKSISPAINRGTSLFAPSSNILGESRLYGTGYNVGAY